MFNIIYANFCYKHQPAKTIIDHSFLHCCQGRFCFWLTIVTSPQLICDVTRRRGTDIFKSYSSIFLARANWRKGHFHWWISTVNIDFLSPSNHDLTYKNLLTYVLPKFEIHYSLNMTNFAPCIYILIQKLTDLSLVQQVCSYEARFSPADVESCMVYKIQCNDMVCFLTYHVLCLRPLLA